MIGGWMWISKWVNEIEKKREKSKEQKEDLKSRHLKSPRISDQNLRRIRLTPGEKRKLQAKITEQGRKTTYIGKHLPGYGLKMVIYFYMAIMILGAAASALIIFIYGDVSYTPEVVKSLLSCLIIIAFCVIWLVLSSIRNVRNWLARTSGITMFLLGSGIIGIGIAFRYPIMIIVSLGIPALIASYFLCFNKNVSARN